MTAAGTRILIIESRYYPSISDAVLDGALEAARVAGLAWDVLTLSAILELPPALSIALEAARSGGQVYDGYVALACVMSDDLLQNRHLVDLVTRSLTDMATAEGLALGQGLMEVPTEDAGLRWAREVDGGGCAVRSCLELIALKQRLAGA
jgi:6,7-dimethyl-8-ribityllumazine synthase